MKATFMHEHTTIDLSGVKNDADCRLDCFDSTVQEFRKLKELGIGRIVDVTTAGMGRNVEYVSRVAALSGMEITLSTGYYKEPFFPLEVYRLSEKQLAAKMRLELEQGVGESGVRARLIGEIGTGVSGFTTFERKVFRAAARAHCENGATITTHTTLGKFGLEQIELLTALGVEPERVVIGHADLSGDCDYILRMLECGVTAGFDTVGKKNYLSDEKRAELLGELCKRGYAAQLVLSMDITRKSHLKVNGGLGYSYLAEEFLPLLEKNGVTGAQIRAMLEENPARLLEASN